MKKIRYSHKNNKAPFAIYEAPCGTPRTRTYSLFLLYQTYYMGCQELFFEGEEKDV